jgi:hypothetical protein
MLKFTWGDDTDHYLSCDILFRYGPRDLDVLQDMCQVKRYHGDTYHVSTGRHGFNLCSDNEIRQAFAQLTLAQKEDVLRIQLSSVDWSTAAARNDNDIFDLIDRYYRWRQETMPTLTRCLHILFQHIFKARNPARVPGYPGATRLGRMLDIRTKICSIASHDTVWFFESRVAPSLAPKSHPIFDELDLLFDQMAEYGKFLEKMYTFEPSDRGRFNKWAVYRMFRDQYGGTIPKKYWDRACTYFRQAFHVYGIPWLRHDRFDMIEKSMM